MKEKLDWPFPCESDWKMFDPCLFLKSGSSSFENCLSRFYPLMILFYFGQAGRTPVERTWKVGQNRGSTETNMVRQPINADVVTWDPDWWILQDLARDQFGPGPDGAHPMLAFRNRASVLILLGQPCIQVGQRLSCSSLTSILDFRTPIASDCNLQENRSSFTLIST